MINHVRTLLLNKPGLSVSLTTPFAEYVPPVYAELPMGAEALSVKHLLFGASPDELYVNYRLRQFMQLIHTSPLQSFATLVDPRITYNFESENFFESVFTASAFGEDADKIQFVGEATADENNGFAEFNWHIEGVDSTTLRITDMRNNTVTTLQKQAVTRIPGNSLRFHLTGTFQNGDECFVSAKARPQRTLAEILLLLNSGEHAESLLKTIKNSNAVCSKLVTEYRLTTNSLDKLAAFLLAFAYYLKG